MSRKIGKLQQEELDEYFHDLFSPRYKNLKTVAYCRVTDELAKIVSKEYPGVDIKGKFLEFVPDDMIQEMDI